MPEKTDKVIICAALGRAPATPDEAREIMGIRQK